MPVILALGRVERRILSSRSAWATSQDAVPKFFFNLQNKNRPHNKRSLKNCKNRKQYDGTQIKHLNIRNNKSHNERLKAIKQKTKCDGQNLDKT
jgi:CRISPR/Cas system-associated endonuclease/helicase Cas3